MSKSEEKLAKRDGSQGNFLRYFLASFAGAMVALSGVGLLIYFGAVGVREGVQPPSVVSEPGISYADFISIMLTAVTVILAAVAIGIGVLAVISWRRFETYLDNRIEKKVEEFAGDLENQVEGLKQYLESQIEALRQYLETQTEDLSQQSERALELMESIEQEKINSEDLVNELEENNDPSEDVGNTIGD